MVKISHNDLDLPRDDSFDLYDGEDFRGEDDYSDRTEDSGVYENLPESITSFGK